jgi:DNA-binding FadR family transcriptional regulator
LRQLSGDARRAVFAPLDEGTFRSKAVVRRLGSAIALGLIPDGERLPAETALAASLNVSTMTLREALADLRARGLVVTRRGRDGGSFVQAHQDALDGLSQARLRQLGTADLRELGDVHAAIAGATARLAAARASESEIARLRDIVDRLSTSRQEAQQRRLDGRFYVEIAASAQSVRLTLAEIDIQSELGQTPWPAEGSAIRFTETLQAHRMVIAAIAAHDGDRARSLAEDHLAARTRWLVEMRLHVGTVASPTPLVPRANRAPAEETSR